MSIRASPSTKLPLLALAAWLPQSAYGRWSSTSGLLQPEQESPLLLFSENNDNDHYEMLSLRGGQRQQRHLEQLLLLEEEEEHELQQHHHSRRLEAEECVNATSAFDLTVPNDEMLAEARDQATVAAILSTCPQGVPGEEVACVVDYLQTEGHQDYEKSCLDSMGKIYYWSLTFQCYSESDAASSAFVSLMNEVGCYDPDSCSLKDSIDIAGDLHLSYYPLYETILNETVSDFVCSMGTTVVTDDPVSLQDMNITIMMMDGGVDNNDLDSSGMNTTTTAATNVDIDPEEEEIDMPVMLDEEEEEEEVGSPTNTTTDEIVDPEEDYQVLVLEAEEEPGSGTNMTINDNIDPPQPLVETEDEELGSSTNNIVTNITTTNATIAHEADQMLLQDDEDEDIIDEDGAQEQTSSINK